MGKNQLWVFGSYTKGKRGRYFATRTKEEGIAFCKKRGDDEGWYDCYNGKKAVDWITSRSTWCERDKVWNTAWLTELDLAERLEPWLKKRVVETGVWYPSTFSGKPVHK